MKLFINIEKLLSDDPSDEKEWMDEAIKDGLEKGRRHPPVEPFIPFLLREEFVGSKAASFLHTGPFTGMNLYECARAQQLELECAAFIETVLKGPFEEWKMDHKQLSPAALLALSSGSKEESFLDEVRKIIRYAYLRDRGYVE